MTQRYEICDECGINVSVVTKHLPGCSFNREGNWIGQESFKDPMFDFTVMLSDIILTRTKKSLRTAAAAVGIENFNSLPEEVVDIIGVMTISQFTQFLIEQDLLNYEGMIKLIAEFNSLSGPEDLLK